MLAYSPLLSSPLVSPLLFSGCVFVFSFSFFCSRRFRPIVTLQLQRTLGPFPRRRNNNNNNNGGRVWAWHLHGKAFEKGGPYGSRPLCSSSSSSSSYYFIKNIYAFSFFQYFCSSLFLVNKGSGADESCARDRLSSHFQRPYYGREEEEQAAGGRGKKEKKGQTALAPLLPLPSFCSPDGPSQTKRHLRSGCSFHPNGCECECEYADTCLGGSLLPSRPWDSSSSLRSCPWWVGQVRSGQACLNSCRYRLA